MSAKNLSPRMFCVLGLVCVFVIVGLLFLTTDFQNTLIGACVALLALIG